MVFDDAI